MGVRVEYKRFFAISEDGTKFFNTVFEAGLNIIHGKNTSGKSTLIQAILYTLGINSENKKLEEVLSEDLIFRLDLKIINDNFETEDITIIRDAERLVFNSNKRPARKFNGIGADHAAEHIKLKEFIGDLLGCNLFLESAGEYKRASIEAIFLPYYIAQDVGWIYKHKSFRGLDFVKNFKRDFFDYYAGIINNYDREEKQKLEKQKKECESEIKYLSEIEDNDDELKLSKLVDERFQKKTTEYLVPYKEHKEKLIELEKDYLKECNRLAFLEQRKSVLSRVKRAIAKQNPLNAKCPTCSQHLPCNTEKIYNFHQNVNDTDEQLAEIKKNIKDMKSAQGRMNTLSKKISELQKVIEKEYMLLEDYNADNLSYSNWLDNKTNVKLSGNIEKKVFIAKSTLDGITKKLEKYKAVKEVEEERESVDIVFKGYFRRYLKALDVKSFENPKYFNLYNVPNFPKQGVELLKTLMAYNFAFNKLISNTNYVHRLPFLMDAIFEGDFEKDNKELILTFINNHLPSDTQTIISIADTKNNDVPVDTYNAKFFNNRAKLICIGDNKKERAFLSMYLEGHSTYLDEIYELID